MKIGFLNKVFTVVLLVFMMAAFAGCGEQTVEKSDIKIATGDTAGTYYPIGGAITEAINKNVSSLNVAVESTKGSVDNINRLKDGKADLAIIQNDIAYYAANGTEMFKDKKVDNLRGLASLYPETCQFVTLADKDILSINDLRGKKIAVGAEGSGAEANARQILEAYGLTYKDIDAQYLSFTEGAAALKDGKVDAAFLTAGYPTKAVQDIAKQSKIRLLPIENDKASILIGLYPYYTRTTIPKNSYDGLDEDVQTISVMALLATTDKLSDNNGREITKAIFDSKENLQSAHEVAKFINIKNAALGMSIKMNSGAEKYIRDFSGK